MNTHGANLSFSCEGEDILIKKVFERMFFKELLGPGTYVDVGAYDPWKHSNTASLWLEGWSGVNIDPSRAAIEKFDGVRPGDINICSGVGRTSEVGTYTMFDRNELNGFLTDPQIKAQEARGASRLGEEYRQINPLDTLLALPAGRHVDLLSIDVEGLELAVLQGFSMKGSQRPMVIACEVLERGWGGFIKHPVVEHLKGRGFVCLSRLHCSTIFVDEERAVFR